MSGLPPPRESDRISLAKTRVLGAGLILFGLTLAYFFMYLPIQRGLKTGQVSYQIAAIVWPPALLYTGVALLLADLRDGQIKTIGEDGQPKLTRKGRLFLTGAAVVMSLSAIAWYVCLYVLGFHMF